MPIKLQVVKEGADGADPADYLFEQEVITIGRGSGNDLTIPDQKVSKQHAKIVQDGGDYQLFDRESKNHTFVAGDRVGVDEPYLLKSGDVINVGDFRIEFVPLFMPSSEQTAFADTGEDQNPFEKHAAQLARAIKGLTETYTYAPAGDRDNELGKAMTGALSGTDSDNQVLAHLVETFGGRVGGDGSAAQGDPTPDGRGGTPEYVNEVVDMLLESVARMISIPTHFWREFSGNTVVQPPEKSFLHRADVDSLRQHVLDPDIGKAEREKRLDHLREAVNTLVAHNVAMLAGYKKAAMKGSKDLLDRVDPSDAYDEAKSGGGFSNIFAGSGDESTAVKELYQTWRDLHTMEWGALEKDLFRPTYIDAYLDRMAKAWDVEKSEIVEDR
jgi:pSer/pThr/pTyr-binding forkhead associated (FHA) protein